MKKVININFQGRVIPIEETAYESLKQYIESLRRYFANEEGKDEIINDIEGRIAELFSERLQKGGTCITDEDVNAVIASMGRPEDFDAQDIEGATATGGGQQTYTEQPSSGPSYVTGGRSRLVRNADDKILGGVCSGLANYFRIDPVIMRIVFVVLFGALFWVYILLWIIVPSQSVQSNITKRLYRNPDDKVIAGVAGGLAAYFNIEVWIPRLIFSLPLLLALISGTFNVLWWDWDFGFLPRMVSGSLGSTLFVTYIILWIAVPLATTAAEKLEMRGERINLNSIRDTVKEDLESFKSRAEKWGAEVKQSAQQMGERAKEFGQSAGSQAKNFAAEAGPAVRRTGGGLGHVIGVLFKAFFLFVAGMIAITLFGVLIGLLFGGFAIFPFKNFILDGVLENMLAWGSLFLFLGIPLVALLTWLIRRIIGARSKNHYLGYVFGSLWVIGLICTIALAAMVGRDFRSRSVVEEPVTSFQSDFEKLYVDVQPSNVRYYGSDWFGLEGDEDWPIYGLNQDTLMLNTVRVNVVKSPDSSYHLYKIRFGRGRNPQAAKQIADKIRFDIQQQDSLLLLPKGFAISKDEKFRNQQVLVVIEVPVGKRIQLDRSINYYDWFSIELNRRRGWNGHWDEHWDQAYGWDSNVEYIMTPTGLERVDKLDEAELKKGKFKFKIQDGEINIEGEGEFDNKDNPGDDRYQYRRDSSVISDSVRDRTSISIEEKEEVVQEEVSILSNRFSSELSAPLSVFARLFQ